MLNLIQKILTPLRHTVLHPQWLAYRYHRRTHHHVHTINNSNVLDIGSGNAAYHATLKDNNFLVTLDYPKTSRRYNHDPDLHGSADALPVADNSFDYALLLEVLEHIRDDRVALDEAFRALKPGGRLLISVPFMYPMHDRPFDYRRYSVYGLIFILENAGFNIIEYHKGGNSAVAVCQLFNLMLMELTFKAMSLTALLGALIGLITWPLTIVSNITAIIFLPAKFLDANHLGYFAVAEKPDQK